MRILYSNKQRAIWVITIYGHYRILIYRPNGKLKARIEMKISLPWFLAFWAGQGCVPGISWANFQEKIPQGLLGKIRKHKSMRLHHYPALNSALQIGCVKFCSRLYIRCDSKKKCQILSSHRTFMPTNMDLKLWLTNFYVNTYKWGF